jgi:hypothetical protein
MKRLPSCLLTAIFALVQLRVLLASEAPAPPLAPGTYVSVTSYVSAAQSISSIELRLESDGAATYRISSWEGGTTVATPTSDTEEGRWTVDGQMVTVSLSGKNAGKSVVYRMTECLSYQSYGGSGCSFGLQPERNTMSRAFGKPLWNASRFFAPGGILVPARGLVGMRSSFQQPTTAELHAAMDKLDWMIGKWEGTGWIESATDGRREFSYSVTVHSENDGLLLIVDGVGTGARGGSNVTTERDILYAEQLLISGPSAVVVPAPAGSGYTWWEFSRSTLLRGNDATGSPRGVWVGLPLNRSDCDQISDEKYRTYCRTGGEPLWSRTAIFLNDRNEWVETREWQDHEPDHGWHMIFEVVLRRVEQEAK